MNRSCQEADDPEVRLALIGRALGSQGMHLPGWWGAGGVLLLLLVTIAVNLTVGIITAVGIIVQMPPFLNIVVTTMANINTPTLAAKVSRFC